VLVGNGERRVSEPVGYRQHHGTPYLGSVELRDEAIGSTRRRQIRRAAHEVVTGIARDLMEPGDQRRLDAVGMPVLQNAEEDVLDEIFGRRPVVQHPREEAEQRPVMAFEEDAQAIQIAIPDGKHQRFVADHFWKRETAISGRCYRVSTNY
jgi:hypothetical protein